MQLDSYNIITITFPVLSLSKFPCHSSFACCVSRKHLTCCTTCRIQSARATAASFSAPLTHCTALNVYVCLTTRNKSSFTESRALSHTPNTSFGATEAAVVVVFCGWARRHPLVDERDQKLTVIATAAAAPQPPPSSPGTRITAEELHDKTRLCCVASNIPWMSVLLLLVFLQLNWMDS